MFEIIHDKKILQHYYKTAKEKKIDLIYERLHAFHSSGIRTANKFGIPFIIEVNDPLRESESMSFSFLKQLAFYKEKYILKNANCVVLGSNTLRNYYLKKGLKEAKWPGRLEIIQKKPLVMVEGAHNVEGMEKLKDFLLRILFLKTP